MARTRVRRRPYARLPHDHDAISLKQHRALSPAQAFAVTAGMVLLIAGAFGFLESDSFDTDGLSVDFTDGRAGTEGDQFVGLLVNGWHNVVHLGTGAVLLVGAIGRALARWTVLVFGLVYAVVTAWGFIDTEDILGVIPVNTADNIFHAGLTGLALLTAGVSFWLDRRDRRHLRSAEGLTGRRAECHPDASVNRDGRYGRTPAEELDPLTGRPRDRPTGQARRD